MVTTLVDEAPGATNDLDHFYARSDALVAAATERLDTGPSLADRLIFHGARLLLGRRAGTMVGVWVVAVVVVVGTAASRARVTVPTQLGTASARCGLDIFVNGHPDPAVSGACRHAESARLALFLPALGVVVVGAGFFAITFLLGTRRGGSRRLPRWTTTLLVPVVATGLAALALGAAAARPVTAVFEDQGAVVTVQCGADTYLSPYPEGAVRDACDRAFAGHARLLETAIGVEVVMVVLLGALLVARGASRRSRMRRLLVGGGLVATGVAVLFLHPVPVQIDGDATPVVASCGIDTVLAGHPDAAVQHACRAKVGGQSAAALGAGGLAVALFVAAMVLAPEDRHSMPRNLQFPDKAVIG